MSLYERFEQIVALVLSGVIVFVVGVALARKFVVLDANTSPAKIAALAGALLALGIVYWLVREHGAAAPDRKLD